MLRKGFIGFSNVRRSTYGSSSRYSQFIRYNSTTSWLNPLSKFKKKEVPKTVNIPSIIIEEPEPNTYSTNSNNTNQHAPSNKALIRDLKHYLKSDVPDIIRVKVLTDKLSQYIHNVPDFALDKQAIPLINKVFMKLQQLGGAQEVLPLPDLLVLFEKSAIAITNTSSLLASLYVPEYVAFLARHFLTDFGGKYQ